MTTATHAHAWERRIKSNGTFTQYHCRYCTARWNRGRKANIDRATYDTRTNTWSRDGVIVRPSFA